MPERGWDQEVLNDLRGSLTHEWWSLYSTSGVVDSVPPTTFQHLSLGSAVIITISREGSRGNTFMYGIIAVLAACYHCTQGSAGVRVREVGHGLMEGKGGEIDEALCD